MGHTTPGRKLHPVEGDTKTVGPKRSPGCQRGRGGTKALSLTPPSSSGDPDDPCAHRARPCGRPAERSVSAIEGPYLRSVTRKWDSVACRRTERR